MSVYSGNQYTAADIRNLKKDISSMPPGLSRAAISKRLCEKWKMGDGAMKRWLSVAESFSDEVIDLFESNQINRNRLNEIARNDYKNPSYRDFLARKAVECNLSTKELREIRDYVHKGRHPLEAIDILRGKRPERPITRNDEMSIDRIAKEWEKDGFSWRQRAEIIRAMGKIQALQNGELKNRIMYSLSAMKVAVDDMKRYIDELWKEVPVEMQEAVMAEFRGSPSASVAEPFDRDDGDVADIPPMALPAPAETEASIPLRKGGEVGGG
jgi:hypothetical protein